MTPPMARSWPPRLAPLGMLVWWAATSPAMPIGTPPGTLHETDGPAAHELSLQPLEHVGRGAHLDFERRRASTCDAHDDEGPWTAVQDIMTRLRVLVKMVIPDVEESAIRSTCGLLDVAFGKEAIKNPAGIGLILYSGYHSAKDTGATFEDVGKSQVELCSWPISKASGTKILGETPLGRSMKAYQAAYGTRMGKANWATASEALVLNSVFAGVRNAVVCLVGTDFRVLDDSILYDTELPVLMKLGAQIKHIYFVNSREGVAELAREAVAAKGKLASSQVARLDRSKRAAALKELQRERDDCYVLYDKKKESCKVNLDAVLNEPGARRQQRRNDRAARIKRRKEMLQRWRKFTKGKSVPPEGPSKELVQEFFTHLYCEAPRKAGGAITDEMHGATYERQLQKALKFMFGARGQQYPDWVKYKKEGDIHKFSYKFQTAVHEQWEQDRVRDRAVLCARKY